MVRVVAYLRPHQLEDVKTAVSNLGISGLTVTDVRGCGNSPEQSTSLGGHEMVVALPLRSKLEVVVQKSLEDEVVLTIVNTARTGEPGDGKVFVEPILDAVRIRTEERGDSVV